MAQQLILGSLFLDAPELQIPGPFYRQHLLVSPMDSLAAGEIPTRLFWGFSCPSASARRALDAGDQLHVASGACSHPGTAHPAPLEGGKKALFLSGSIRAASPDLNPSLSQSVPYQILQKVEYRGKKNVSPRWETCAAAGGLGVMLLPN